MSGPLTMTARVGYRWRVTFTVEPGGIDAGTVTALMMRWSPKVPRQLSAREWADYRAARDRFIAELGRLRGGRIAVVEPSLGRVHVAEPAAGGAAEVLA